MELLMEALWRHATRAAPGLSKYNAPVPVVPIHSLQMAYVFATTWFVPADSLGQIVNSRPLFAPSAVAAMGIVWQGLANAAKDLWGRHAIVKSTKSASRTKRLLAYAVSVAFVSHHLP